jgi:hypothetical protein
MRGVSKFDKLGLPQRFFDFYKTLEPYYWLDGRDSSAEVRDYVTIRIGPTEVYTGEVDKNGKKCGKGTRVLISPEYFFIEEGIFVNE